MTPFAGGWPLFLLHMASLAILVSPFLAETGDLTSLGLVMAFQTILHLFHVVPMGKADSILQLDGLRYLLAFTVVTPFMVFLMLF
jgi:hypothetical protein